MVSQEKKEEKKERERRKEARKAKSAQLPAHGDPADVEGSEYSRLYQDSGLF